MPGPRVRECMTISSPSVGSSGASLDAATAPATSERPRPRTGLTPLGTDPRAESTGGPRLPPCLRKRTTRRGVRCRALQRRCARLTVHRATQARDSVSIGTARLERGFAVSYQLGETSSANPRCPIERTRASPVTGMVPSCAGCSAVTPARSWGTIGPEGLESATAKPHRQSTEGEPVTGRHHESYARRPAALVGPDRLAPQRCRDRRSGTGAEALTA